MVWYVAIVEEDTVGHHRLGPGCHPPGTPLVVHAAPLVDWADAPDTTTVCGMPTAGLREWRPEPGRSGEPWFPPRWSEIVCPRCRAAVTAGRRPTRTGPALRRAVGPSLRTG